VRSTDHEAPHYEVFSTPLLLRRNVGHASKKCVTFVGKVLGFEDGYDYGQWWNE
jgi:hypothetical protein